jgi:hypothetical protein
MVNQKTINEQATAQANPALTPDQELLQCLWEAHLRWLRMLM